MSWPSFTDGIRIACEIIDPRALASEDILRPSPSPIATRSAEKYSKKTLTEHLYYFCLDLLAYGGDDIRHLPLTERATSWKKFLAG